MKIEKAIQSALRAGIYPNKIKFAIRRTLKAINDGNLPTKSVSIGQKMVADVLRDRECKLTAVQVSEICETIVSEKLLSVDTLSEIIDALIGTHFCFENEDFGDIDNLDQLGKIFKSLFVEIYGNIIKQKNKR